MPLWRRIRTLLGPARILVGSFLGLILAGTTVLSLPQATRGEPLPLLDALFTATSATCVTGLVVVDTGTRFTLLGQLAILTMIQLGGLGIMTFSTLFVYMLGGRLTFGTRDVLQETLSQEPLLHLKTLLKTVFLVTFSFELVGAALLSLRFLEDMAPAQAVYYGLFHAVSAFCNAGFSLFPDSFVAYRLDPLINVTLATLIVVGGLGFVVVLELIRRARGRTRTLSLHARLVLMTSAVLIGLGTLVFLLFEEESTLGGYSWPGKILVSLFQSITARTAGFNTVNMAFLTNPTLFMLIVLMFIGASPGSTGGGIKTTTVAILLSMIRARFHTQEDVNLLNRRVPSAILSKAISVAFFSTVLVVLFTMLLLSTELAGLTHQQSRGLFLEILFEVTSAFGTVGLSTGVTPTLSNAGRALIILLMFVGRLGPLTVAMAVGGQQRQKFKFAKENIMVG